MLNLLIRFAIRHHAMVIIAALLLVIYGIERFVTAGLDIFPEFSPKQIVIQTEAPGYSAEQVETLVTQTVESSISGVIGLKTVRSESIQGLSVITAVFDEKSDIYFNRQMVGERLAGISNRLPHGIEAPKAVPLSSSSATILTIGLHSDRHDLMKLRSLVDWMIVPRLMAVPGVADVNVFGGEIRQLQIQADSDRLQRFGLSLDEVVQAAAEASQIYGGGFVETDNQRFSVTLSGSQVTPERLQEIIVRQGQGRGIKLGDVADIRYGPEPPIGAAQILGHSGVVMMVIGQYGANTLTVSKLAEKALSEFDALFAKEEIDFYPSLFRPADYIESSLQNLSGHLLIGAMCVLIILYLFLFDMRTAFIAATAIPVSLIAAVLVLLEYGVNLNIMVLGGLAIALGEVVDDAIIDTENIFRRLRENSLSSTPRPVSEVIYSASIEVRESVVYASFIVALVFVPLLTLTGIAGRLFSPLGMSYILAILMSLFTALTLTPALCFALLGKNVTNLSDPPSIRFLKPLYRRLLGLVNQYLKTALTIAVILCIVGLCALFLTGNRFLPPLREGHFIVHTSSIPGTSLRESIRIGSKITEQFMQIPGIVSVSQWAGRAERGADTYGSHYSEYEVRLQTMSGREQQQVLSRLRETLDGIPGIVYEANTFLTERVDETISGFTSPLAVVIFGNDLSALDDAAGKISKLIQSIPGAADVIVRSPPGTPMLEIRPKLDRLAFFGLRPAHIMNTVQIAYEGRIVGKYLDGNRIDNIAVTLDADLRNKPEALEKLPIRAPDGTLLKLGQVAKIEQTSARYNILHEGAQRRQTITANIIGRDYESFVAELKQRVFDEINFPSGMYPEFTGTAIEQAEARRDLIRHSLLAGVGVLILIQMAIGSFRHTLLTLANLPFALIGGVAAVLLTGATVSVGSVVGFITLFGITVRNSIMLISHYRHLVIIDGKNWNIATAVQGAEERLPSILMTALVTALAMLPIALNSDNPGREIMGPMAAIIIGGLASSTLLNLFLMPAILLRFGNFSGERTDRQI